MAIQVTSPLPVVSGARKLVFPVPNGPVIGFPNGAVVSKSGQNNMSPVIVVRNATDGGSWQGADSDGFVIMNAVKSLPAHVLLTVYWILYLLCVVRSMWRPQALMLVCQLAHWMGYGDQYTGKPKFVRDNLSSAGRVDKLTGAGMFKRDARDVFSMAWVDGVLSINHGNGWRRIEPEIALRDYRHVDGLRIDLDDVPCVDPDITD
jgi:hypothetical protein